MKIICIGVNYRDHALEMGRKFPEVPVVFMKPDSSLIKNNKPFFLPPFSEDVHYEGELVLKISKLGKGIAAKYASRYFNEITMGIDITARDLQRKQGGAGLPWEIGKSFDGSAPVGKFLSTELFPDPGNIDFRLEKNGKVVQHGNNSNLIFSFDQIIEYISKFFTLKTGDLIFTGTPSGVGPLSRNDRLTGYIGDEKVIDFVVK